MNLTLAKKDGKESIGNRQRKVQVKGSWIGRGHENQRKAGLGLFRTSQVISKNRWKTLDNCNQSRS